MSKEFVNRAYRAQVGSPAAKHVLTVIADHVADDGAGWVAVSRIVTFTELSESTVRRSIGHLIKKGLMSCELNGGTFRTNRYLLHLPDWRPPGTVTGGDGVTVTGGQGEGVSPGQGDGVTVTGGEVSPCQGGGVTVTPNPSLSSRNHQNPSFGAGAAPKGKGPEFPADFPEALQPALVEWWHYKLERGEGYKPRGWMAVLRAAKRHSVDVVAMTVENAMRNSWAGAYFERTEQFFRAPHSQQNREKKEGGAPVDPFAGPGVEPAGFPWEQLAIEEKGAAPTLPWDKQTARFRSDMRKLWAALPAERREDLARSDGAKNREKKEAAA